MRRGKFSKNINKSNLPATHKIRNTNSGYVETNNGELIKFEQSVDTRDNLLPLKTGELFISPEFTKTTKPLNKPKI